MNDKEISMKSSDLLGVWHIFHSTASFLTDAMFLFLFPWQTSKWDPFFCSTGSDLCSKDASCYFCRVEWHSFPLPLELPLWRTDSRVSDPLDILILTFSSQRSVVINPYYHHNSHYIVLISYTSFIITSLTVISTLSGSRA